MKTRDMCGIVGIVDYTCDLKNTDTVNGKAMVETMARRGPDSGGLWSTSHVVLGHRRLAVIDLQGGAQPMVYSRGERPTVALAYNGELYNFRELRTRLANLGHEFQSGGDTEVLLHAYLEWGVDVPAHLEGMFAFAVWDEATQELLLVRDRLGIKPLYYAATHGGVLFGSEPKALLATGRIKPSVDLDGLREMATMVKTPGEAVFVGMRELRPGHIARVNRRGLTETRYWSLQATEHTDDLPSTIANIRQLLEDLVREHLVAEVPLGVLLSGGLDSSTTTALAQRILRGQGLPALRTFAVDFVGQTSAFKAEQIFRDTPDAPYAVEMARHAGSRHIEVVLDKAEMLTPAVQAATLAARDLPAVWGDMDTSLYLLFKAVRSHVTVALTGEGADEVFGGYAWSHLSHTVDAPTFPWMATSYLKSENSPFTPDLAKQLDLRAYVGDRYAQALGEVPRLAGEDPREARMRELSYLNLSRFLQNLLDRVDRLSMAVGLEVRVPFCDHRLVSYVFNTPWAMKTFDGREKSLLRAAAHDLLPATISQRKKAHYPAIQDLGYDDALRSRLSAMLARKTGAALELLDHAQLRALLERPSTGLHADRSVLEFALNLNGWMETYGVQVAI
jgi:asparagine synthase (glutamine-hydrolysing)